MSDIVTYVGCARGVHHDIAAAPCADTQTLAGPDRCPQLELAETSSTSPVPWGGRGEFCIGHGYGHGLDCGETTS
jgi:hypothetical protein